MVRLAAYIHLEPALNYAADSSGEIDVTWKTLTIGQSTIDNNPIENAIRLIAIGKKYWRFASSRRAATLPLSRARMPLPSSTDSILHAGWPTPSNNFQLAPTAASTPCICSQTPPSYKFRWKVERLGARCGTQPGRPHLRRSRCSTESSRIDCKRRERFDQPATQRLRGVHASLWLKPCPNGRRDSVVMADATPLFLIPTPWRLLLPLQKSNTRIRFTVC
jgi:hypothetical protein